MDSLKEYAISNFDPIYKDLPKLYYTLDKALCFISKKVKSFIICHECEEEYLDGEGNTKVREREFYVFHDIKHYIYHMDKYPHSHEVIHGIRYGDNIGGRLVFDFDIKNKGNRSTWVDQGFEAEVDIMVKNVLLEFYKDVNIDIIEPIWSTCQHDNKYSRHLTYMNVYFSTEWSIQLKTFYLLCEYIIDKHNLFSYMGELRYLLIDQGIARNNATLRMPFNSKIGGSPIMIDDYKGPESFFNSLIQITETNVFNEQHIDVIQLNRAYILKISGCSDPSTKKITNKSPIYSDQTTKDNKKITGFLTLCAYGDKKKTNDAIMKVSKMLISEPVKTSDITPDYIDKIKDMISKDRLMSSYKYMSYNKGFINLDRLRASRCLVSKKIHEHRQAYITVYNNKAYLSCRNAACKTETGSKSILLYML